MCPVYSGQRCLSDSIIPGHCPVWQCYFIGHTFLVPVVGYLGVRYGGVDGIRGISPARSVGKTDLVLAAVQGAPGCGMVSLGPSTMDKSELSSVVDACVICLRVS